MLGARVGVSWGRKKDEAIKRNGKGRQGIRAEIGYRLCALIQCLVVFLCVAEGGGKGESEIPSVRLLPSSTCATWGSPIRHARMYTRGKEES